MSEPNGPERIRWAVKTLDIKSSDRLLEIGGGPGVAASIICERRRGAAQARDGRLA